MIRVAAGSSIDVQRAAEIQRRGASALQDSDCGHLDVSLKASDEVEVVELLCNLCGQPGRFMAFLSYICCDCWGYRQKPSRVKAATSDCPAFGTRFSQQNLLGTTIEEVSRSTVGKGGRPPSKSALISAASSINVKGYEEVDLHSKFFHELRGTAKVSQSDIDDVFILPRCPVKHTTRAFRHEDSDGNKSVNEYVRDCKIGTGSYGKVVLHRSRKDDRLYAIKIFHKSRLRKVRVAPAETAMMDVLREVDIMKKLDHPNIVKLVEVIDDPDSDYFYMVLEYMEGRWIFEGSGPPGGIGAPVARRYFRDVVAGLTYLHRNNIVHGDIKPENLLISSEGRIKICDFGVSRTFENDNDELRRSPGTPVYTAPECCLGVTYRGRAADVWALGCTLYCMVLGRYPFVGNSLQATYEKIANDEFWYPADMDPDLLDLLRRLLCKDPELRITLDAVVHHPWMTQGHPPPFASTN